MDERAADRAGPAVSDDGPATAALIAVDWGSSQLRITALTTNDDVVESWAGPDGILRVPRSEQTGLLSDRIAPFRTRWPHVPIVAAGMIGSRNGLIETTPVSVPASARTVAAGIRPTTVGDSTIHVLPGLVDDSSDPPELIRGEEAQILGWTMLRRDSIPHASEAAVIVPGTHSKWARVTGETITQFRTFLTGELYAQLQGLPSLVDATADTRPRPASQNDDSFREGAGRGLAGTGLLHALFGARGRLLSSTSDFDIDDYLSGLLIGSEIAEARAGGLIPARGPAVLICDPPLRDRYCTALGMAGTAVDVVDRDVFAVGVHAIYRRYAESRQRRDDARNI